MVYSENAKIMSPEEVKDLIEEHFSNPMIDRMMFVETRETPALEGRIFPCYAEAYGTERGEFALQCTIVTLVNGEFNMVRVVIHNSELGVTKRIWDKPPTKGLREQYPFVEIGGGVS